MDWFLFPALALLGALVVLSGKAVRLKAAALCVLLLALSAWWLVDRLSGDGFNAATLYHLQAEMQGAAVSEFSGDILRFALLAAASLATLLLLRVRRFRLPAHGGAVLLVFAVVLVATAAASPLGKEGKRLAQRLQPVETVGIAAEYVRPAGEIRRPRNVVWIYGESLERTYLDERTFPGLMPNLARLASQGLDVRDLGQVEGTGWTIAGMVASMCGVPLTTAPGDENSMARMERFLPDALCMGEVLKQQGYSTHFLGGADAAFAGKGRFLRSHGFDDVRDMEWFRENGVDDTRFSQWGVHDDVLLETAWKRFEQLSQGEQPFLLTTLTMDTHHPAGHLPLTCSGQSYDSPHGDIGLLHALKCSDRLIGAFVDRIRNSAYADDTLVVIASDHLAMPNHLSKVLGGLDRENLLLFLGKDIAPRALSATRGSTLDTGATLLQLLEPGMRAIGFGRSLLDTNATPSASVAARTTPDGDDFRRYLAYARSLWTGDADGTLRMGADARLTVGHQRIEPPVLLQYDASGNLASVTLENALGQLSRNAGKHPMVYVQRCIAFADADAARDGEWCALTVDRTHQARLLDNAQLHQGIRIGTQAGRIARSGPQQGRVPVTVAHRVEDAAAGNYVLRLWTDKRPSGGFWVDAVTADGQVLGTHWVQPDARGRVQLPLALDDAQDVVRLRGWVDQGEHFSVGRHALVPVRHLAQTQRNTRRERAQPSG